MTSDSSDSNNFNSLEVQPTGNRQDSRGEYIVRITESKQRELGIFGQDFVTVKGTKNLPGKLNDSDDPLPPPKVLAALRSEIGWEDLNDNQCRLDMTLRDAIGVEPGDKVTIEKVPRGWLNSCSPSYLAKKFGFQWIVCRVQKAFGDDMEMPICRASAHVLETLGLPQGGVVVIESVNGSVRRRLLPLHDHQREDTPVSSKLSENTLFKEIGAIADFDGYLNPDVPSGRAISKLHIDDDTRKELKISLGSPVWVRRGAKEVIYKNICKHGAAFVLAAIGLSFVNIPAYPRIQKLLSWLPLLAIVVLVGIALRESRSEVH